MLKTCFVTIYNVALIEVTLRSNSKLVYTGMLTNPNYTYFFASKEYYHRRPRPYFPVLNFAFNHNAADVADTTNSRVFTSIWTVTAYFQTQCGLLFMSR